MKNELVRNNVPKANVLILEHTARKNAGSLLCGLHYHNEIEILLITSGEMNFTVNNKPHYCRAGDTVFFSPRIPHATYNGDTPCSYILLQFRLEHYIDDSSSVDKNFNRFINNADTPFFVLRNDELARLIKEAFREAKERAEGFGLSIKGAIYTVVAHLCREGAITLRNENVSDTVEKLLPTIAYIEENYAKNITLNEIAEIQRLHPSYFCRLFKKASGSSFIDYLNFVRICKSEKLLAQSDKSILEIACEVGFSSLSYFNRIFKRYKNCTPTEYRRAQCVNR